MLLINHVKIRCCQPLPTQVALSFPLTFVSSTIFGFLVVSDIIKLPIGQQRSLLFAQNEVEAGKRR